MKRKISAITGIFLLMTLLSVSSCGFKLRGVEDLPPLYERVNLIDKGYSDFGRSLRRSLEASGSRMVDSHRDATSVITLISRGTQRRALAVRSKEVKEYELQLSVVFAVQDPEGNMIGEQQTVTLVRSYRYDSDDVLGKSNEEETIMEEMDRQIVAKIMRTLKAIGMNQPDS